MAYTFKATCTSTKQNPGGDHLATFTGADGSEMTIPSKDLTFEPNSVYSISVDGKFVKSAACTSTKARSASDSGQILPKLAVQRRNIAPVVRSQLSFSRTKNPLAMMPHGRPSRLVHRTSALKGKKIRSQADGRQA
jgi:hypothetical protein